MRPVVRALYAVLALAFAVSVLVQLNDPDPLPWMGIYGSALVLAVLACGGRPLAWQSVAIGGLAVLWALVLSPSLPRLQEPAVRDWSMKKGDMLAEEARECGGLLVVAASCFAIFMDANAARRRSDSDVSTSATSQRTA